jgi:hypothetical protein
VTNQSNTELTPHQENALTRGINFTLAPRRLSVMEIITSVEACTKRLEPEAAAQWRQKIASELGKPSKFRHNLSPAENDGLAELQKNKEIMVLKADK